MEIKLFEVRDSGTFLPIMCVRLSGLANEQERYLLSRSGYGTTPRATEKYVLAMRLAGGNGRFSYDPHDHGPSRTMLVAHKHIINHWDQLTSGDVVCVEHILGERTTPKQSERIIDQEADRVWNGEVTT